jgi:hypothetical protein
MLITMQLAISKPPEAHMSPTIPVSADVYEYLQQHAEPFIDTPDSVLRRLLGLHDLAPENSPAGEGAHEAARSTRDAPSGTTAAANGASKTKRSAPAQRSRSKRSNSRPPRAPRGSLLKEAAYELPILQILAQRGGRAAKNEVLDALEPLLDDQLTELDRTLLESGEIRWRNRAQFVRLRLVQRGEMENDSPRGIWELAEAGRTRLAGSDVSAGKPGAR